jgi:hypothetical protein
LSFVAHFSGARCGTTCPRTELFVRSSAGFQGSFANVTGGSLEELLIGNRLYGLRSTPAGAAQCCHFLFSQRAKLARFHIQRNTTVARALDLLHMMANLLKHAADLAILALRQRDFIPRIVRLAHQTHLCRRRPYRTHAFRARLAANADSLAQLLNIIFLRQSCHLHQICLGNV